MDNSISPEKEFLKRNEVHREATTPKYLVIKLN